MLYTIKISKKFLTVIYLQDVREPMSKNYWVYILLCDNNSYYTGYTNHLERRYLSHVNGTGRCKYTRSFKPIKIAQAWLVIEDKLLAMQLEREIKKRTRAEKTMLILHPDRLTAHSGVTPILLNS